MLPIQLTIEGLYSYKEKQTIDFTRLTDAGLFGIFGATGSGKSSILEAISFVLFGKTERINRNHGYNMMNLTSNRLYIEFDFYNFENKCFKATREYKRNLKTFESIYSPTTGIYEQVGESWKPTDQSIESILGLSYDNFKRTIIIPQGQFKEFIELGARDRTQMLKEIFQLERFDLADKTALLSHKNKEAQDKLEGQLQQFTNITAEQIEEKQVDLITAADIKNKTSQAFEAANAQFIQLKSLKHDYDALTKSKEQLITLQMEETSYIEKQKSLDEYEKISRVFQPLINEENRLHDVFAKISLEAQQAIESLQQLRQTLTKAQIERNELQPLFNDIPTKREEIKDLKKIRQISESKAKLSELKDRINKGDAYIVQTEKALDIQINEITEAENKISQLAQDKPDSAVLMEVGNWYTHRNNLERNLKRDQDQADKYQQLIKRGVEELAILQVDVETYTATYEQKMLQLVQHRKALNDLKNTLEVQQKLAQYAHELKDGTPCPLCGSEHHPKITHQEDVTDKQQQAKVQYETNEAAIHTLEKEKDKVLDILRKKEFNEKQFNDVLVQINTGLEAIKNHDKAFIWQEFDKNNFADFQAKKNRSLELENEIKKLQEFTRQSRIKETQERAKLNHAKTLMEKLKLEEQHLHSEIETNSKNLSQLTLEDFKNHSIEAIEQLNSSLTEMIETTEKRYDSVLQRVQHLTTQEAAQHASTENIQKQKQQTELQLNDAKTAIKNQLLALQLDIEKVHTTLRLNYDMAKERQAIEDFKLKLNVVKEKVTILQERLDKAAYDPSAYAMIEDNYQQLKTQLDFQTGEVARLESEITSLKQLLKEKKKLSQEYDALSQRAQHLRKMTNLFKAAGFVNYISSIYLRQLCNHANIRFRRMTRNTLSLDINEDNEFEIIDYLNQGRKRSVKTLSGGQIFQISLSLALALAESVQTRSATAKNFFFIDEGFGTQDEQSVNIVFETLLNLTRENKVVGIISHVDELKDRIPISLTIINEADRGSIIDYG
ncbi:MAG: SMC family ATPase [Saprospiraceae bacterium]|nr:SMC family ATPase [Saprospiraceae bacterium]